MASENTESNPGTDEETAGQSSLSAGLTEQALGAEVDCAAGSSPSVSRAGPRRSKRPEDRSCSGCKTEFSKQGRSFNRRAVYTFTTPDTVRWVFPDTTVNEKSFLCENCAQFIRSKCTRKAGGKRTMWLKPSPKKSRLGKEKKGPRMGKKSKAALLVSKSCYKSAFKMLWSAKGARKPMLSFLTRQLKEEMKFLTRQTDSPFHLKVSNRKPLSSFPWRRCMKWAKDKAPLVSTCLVSLFPDIKALLKSSHKMTDELAQKLLERRAVLALSIPLFTRNSWKNNYLQASLGAELQQEGCSTSALDTLNVMGLCQNKYTVSLLLNKLRNCEDLQEFNGEEEMMMMMTPDQIKVEQMVDIEEDLDDYDDEEEMGEEDNDDDDEDDDYDGEGQEGEDIGGEIGEYIEEEIGDLGEPVEEELGEEVEDEEDMEMVAAEEEVEEVEVLEGVQQDDEEEDQEVEENVEIENKRRKKKAKKQAKGEKRKARGKRKAQEDDEEEEDEEAEEDGRSGRKKKRVVVVRLGLL